MTERRNITLTGLPANIAELLGSYFYVPFNAQGSGATKAAYQSDLYDEDAELTINGTTTNIWDNAGWITPFGDNNSGFAPAGAAENNDTADAFWSKLRLDSTFPQQGILVVFDIYFTATPSASEDILACGEPNIADGGWDFQLTAAGAITLNIKANLNGFNASTAALSTSNRHTVLAYMDYANLRANICVDGASVVQGSAWTDLMVLARATTRCVNILGGGGNYAPSSGRLGENGSGARLKNLLIARPTTDISPYLQALCSAFYDNENTLPQELNTYGVVSA